MLPVSMDTYFKDLFPELDAAVLGVLVEFVGAILLVTLAFAVVSYVLNSIGLYSIAKRRGFYRPWLAWIPVGRSYLLGSISDQYILAQKYRSRSNRIFLACIEALTYIVFVVVLIACVSVLAKIQMYIDYQYYWQNVESMLMQGFLQSPPQVSEKDMLEAVGFFEGVCNVLAVILMGYMILNYKVHYDLFASCRPEQKPVFLILGILFPVTLPFFVFACRKRDDGLPGRNNCKENVLC